MNSDSGNRISLVFPVYNEEKIIETTLEHYIPFRRKHNLELIVADDDSTDDTLNRAGKYADKIVLNTTGRRGRSANCNRGAAQSSGDLLLFLDADILIACPDKFFETVYTVFLRNDKWIGGMINHKVYPEEETIADMITHFLWNYTMQLALVFGYAISTPGFQMVKKMAFQQVGGFDERIGIAQDIDLSLRLSKIGKTYFFKDFHIWESPRRYRKMGYISFIRKSSLIWYTMLFKRRSYGEYEVVR